MIKMIPHRSKIRVSAATTLGSELGKAMISVEAYPELKSNETMIQAQLTYNETEAKLLLPDVSIIQLFHS